MKTHSYTLFLCFTYVACSAQSTPFLTELKSRLTNAKRYTLQVMEAMPEANYGYKPVADEMDFRAQSIHIAQNLTWLTSTHLTTKPSPLSEASLKATNQTKAEASTMVTQAYDYAIDAVSEFDAAHFDDSVKFFAGPMTKRQIMLLICDHQTHHRGQLIVYLRLNGLKPPSYVGW